MAIILFYVLALIALIFLVALLWSLVVPTPTLSSGLLGGLRRNRPAAFAVFAALCALILALFLQAELPS